MSEYTGKDVSYYLVEIAAPKRLDPYTAECEDIIEALNMTFAEGCAFKAIWRKCAARTLGIAKAGYKGGLYDAEKTQYYGARMVAVEERLSKVPSAAMFDSAVLGDDRTVRSFLFTPTPPGEDIYAEFAARMGTTDRKVGKAAALGAAYKQPFCPECGYPTDTAGTHYATCSRLTAPEEYKAEAQVAFEEAAGVAEPAAAMEDDSARMQAIGQNGNDGEHYDELEDPNPAATCECCGSREGAFHHADCHLMRKGKLHLAKKLTDLVVGQESPEFLGATPVEDPFADAPDWVKYKAQDEDGEWRRYAHRPVAQVKYGHWVVSKGRIDTDGHGEPNPNWRDTLIARI